MRGKTVKKLRKFVRCLIANSGPNDISKSEKELYKDSKKNWRTKGKAGQKFINLVVAGQFDKIEEDYK